MNTTENGGLRTVSTTTNTTGNTEQNERSKMDSLRAFKLTLELGETTLLDKLADRVRRIRKGK